MLEFKVDGLGELYIKRGGRFRRQHCPFSCASGDGMSGPTINCTDNCPLFGEPKTSQMFIGDKPCGSANTTLSLCHNKILTGTFTDERGKQ